MKLVGKKDKIKGEHGVIITVKDSATKQTKSMTVKEMSFEEVFDRTYMYYVLLSDGYKIYIERVKNDVKDEKTN